MLSDVSAARLRTISFREVDPHEEVARVALGHYVAELAARFPSGFEPGPLVGEPGSIYVVAATDDAPVAYGGIRPIEAGALRTAEIKRMWVDARCRGLGLGARILAHLESLARAQGYERVVLDTNGTLVEAIALYRRAGYELIERYNTNPHAELFFEKLLVPR